MNLPDSGQRSPPNPKPKASIALLPGTSRYFFRLFSAILRDHLSKPLYCRNCRNHLPIEDSCHVVSRLTLTTLTATTILMSVACAPSQTAQPPETKVVTQDETSIPAALPTEVAQAVTSRRGTFVSGEHETRGGVTLTTRHDGTHAIAFDANFVTDNGPDLVVILHRAANPLQGAPLSAYSLQEGEDVVIAPLKSNTGTQEYVLPANIDPADFQSIAVWCRQFNATFGAATLS